MSIKTDNTQTLLNALAEIERLRGRVAELESVLGSAWSSHCLEAVEWTDKARDVLSRSDSAPWIIRRQADAVHGAAMNFGGRDYAEVRLGLSEWAERLIKQADAIEKGERDE